jgi:hypothetical protein
VIVRIKKGVKARREEFGALIFTNRTPILTLNKDAYAIWELIDGERSVDEIINALLTNGSEEVQVRGKVHEFISSCTKLRLIALDTPCSNELVSSSPG